MSVAMASKNKRDKDRSPPTSKPQPFANTLQSHYNAHSGSQAKLALYQ